MEPDILYKYRIDSENTRKIISEKQVWLSSPEKLNDPFDCKAKIFDYEYYKPYTDKMKQAQLEGFIHACMIQGVRSEEGLRGVLQKIKKAPTLDSKHKIMCKYFWEHGRKKISDPKDFVNSIHEKLNIVGILSLSANPISMLMWTHYAWEHQGLCIGFERTPGNELGDEKLCKPIEYMTDFPEVNLSNGFKQEVLFYTTDKGDPRSTSQISYEDSNFQKVLFAKSNEWAYEKEWRFILPKQGLYSSPGNIKEIIFGLRCDSTIKDKYIELCSTHLKYPVLFKQITTKKNSFELMIEPYVK